jgi:hypothetical protein
VANSQASEQGLSAAERAAFKAIVAKGSHSTSDHEELRMPYMQISRPAYLSPRIRLCESSSDPNEYEGEYKFVYTEPRAYPFAFECNVCGLQLEGDEIKAAGMPNVIELPESEVGKRSSGYNHDCRR